MKRLLPLYAPESEQPEPNLIQSSVDAAVAMVRDRMTVRQLGVILGPPGEPMSHDFVTRKLKGKPLIKAGKEFQVPYAVGVQLVKDVLGAVPEPTKRKRRNILEFVEAMEAGVQILNPKFDWVRHAIADRSAA